MFLCLVASITYWIGWILCSDLVSPDYLLHACCLPMHMLALSCTEAWAHVAFSTWAPCALWEENAGRVRKVVFQTWAVPEFMGIAHGYAVHVNLLIAIHSLHGIWQFLLDLLGPWFRPSRSASWWARLRFEDVAQKQNALKIFKVLPNDE